MDPAGALLAQLMAEPGTASETPTTLEDFLALSRPAWMAQGACRGQDSSVWFPTLGESPARAKVICRSCPVQVECLQYALARPMSRGVWGGTSERQRRALRKPAEVPEWE